LISQSPSDLYIFSFTQSISIAVTLIRHLDT
jgi:hypothetical protein